eukprot:EG_transcript_33421
MYHVGGYGLPVAPAGYGQPSGVASIAVAVHAHPLTRLLRDDGWHCDGMKLGGCRSGCTGNWQMNGQVRYRCDMCDFDLCEPCANANRQGAAAPVPTAVQRGVASTGPRNGDGVPVSASFDSYHTKMTRHYCGRMVGNAGYQNPCNTCDGRCGPGNGCQCRSCYAYDAQLAARPGGRTIGAGDMQWLA